jgi:hypothetical protein
MAKNPPEFTSGYGGYGPWPETDMPLGPNPSGGYKDGYYGRFPGGGYGERPTDMWLDSLVYPERPYPDSDGMADRLDARSRAFRVSVGNVTGRRSGPSED